MSNKRNLVWLGGGGAVGGGGIGFVIFPKQYPFKRQQGPLAPRVFIATATSVDEGDWDEDGVVRAKI